MVFEHIDIVKKLNCHSKNFSHEIRDLCQCQLGIRSGFQVLYLVAASLTYLLNLVPSLWRSHTVGQLDGGQLLGRQDGGGGQLDWGWATWASSLWATWLRIGNLGKLLGGNLQAQACWWASWWWATWATLENQRQMSPSLQTASSSVSGASNISENMRIHQKDSERCTHLFNSFPVTVALGKVYHI